jgi:hypothetical protein
MNRWMGQPGGPALLVPLAAVCAAGMTMRAAALGQWRKGIRWRGTFYSLDELHQGARFRLFGGLRLPPGDGKPAGIRATPDAGRAGDTAGAVPDASRAAATTTPAAPATATGR